MKAVELSFRWASCRAWRSCEHLLAAGERLARRLDDARSQRDAARAIALSRRKPRARILEHVARANGTRSDVFTQRNTPLKNGTHAILQLEVVLSKRVVLTTGTYQSTPTFCN